MTTALMLVTAADHWTLADGTRQPTGFWAEEALGPYKVFKDAGYRIVVATPGGIEPTAASRASPRSSTAARRAPSACARPWRPPPS